MKGVEEAEPRSLVVVVGEEANGQDNRGMEYSGDGHVAQLTEAGYRGARARRGQIEFYDITRTGPALALTLTLTLALALALAIASVKVDVNEAGHGDVIGWHRQSDAAVHEGLVLPIAVPTWGLNPA